MLTIGILGSQSLDYYLSLAAEDYYFKGGEPEGTWACGGARALGMTGTVTAEQLRKVFEGFCPRTGKALVQNAGRTKGKRKRRPGWDLTLSPPKDVSCFVTTSIWQTIRSIHDNAVRDTLELLEQTRAFVRRGSGSQNNWRFEAALLVAALFEHTVSRELDPQLHTHALVANMAATEDGRFGALHSPFFFKKHQRHFLGAYYRSLVTHELRTRLSLESYRKGTSFGIEGMIESLVDERSKRAKQIEAYKKKKGIKGGAAAKKATLLTRRSKEDIPPREELNKKWAKENKKHGLTEQAIRKMQRAKPRDVTRDLPKLLDLSIRNMYRKGFSAFSEIELQIEALQESVNWGVHPATLLDALAKELKENDTIIAIPADGGEQRYTTKTIRKSEIELFENVACLQKRSPGLVVDLKVVKRVVARYRITEEQRRAVEQLVRFPGSIHLLDGRAGTGKTSVVLAACKEIWEECGYTVIGAAYTGKAAVELEEATGIPTDTIHWQLADFRKRFGFQAKHHLKQFVRAARRRRTFRFKKPKPVTVDRKTILVVDEMSMANVRQVRRLTRLVAQGGGVLVGVGDSRQLPPVEGQSPFASLCNRIGCAEIKDIIRQREKWARKVANLMSDGESGQALAILASKGFVKPCEDMDAALRQLVQDWSVEGVNRPEQAPILVSTNREAEAANELCQSARLRAGRVGGMSAQITDEDDDGNFRYSCRVYRGDRILFTRNDRKLKVRNGFTGTVIGIEHFGRRISVGLDSGERIIVPVKEYRHLRRGYAYTVHKTQAGTYRNCWVLAGLNQSMPSAYVAMSRAVLNTHVYTSKDLLDTCLEAAQDSRLAQQMSEKPDLRLATDFLEGVDLDRRDEEPECPAVESKPTGWWNTGEREVKPGQSKNWWERTSADSTPMPPLTTSAGRSELTWSHPAKRLAHATTKSRYSEAEREEQRLIEAGRLDEIKARREKQRKSEAARKFAREMAQRQIDKWRRQAAEQSELTKVKRRRAAELLRLANVKRYRNAQETEEQRQYASGQFEREQVKKRHAIAFDALAMAKQNFTDQEQEERERYALAQAETDRRRKALLTQLFLVSSSVYEPRRTEAGNRELLNSSLTAILRCDDSTEEATTVEDSNTPVLNYFLADLFRPPTKKFTSTQDAECLPALKGGMAESEAGVIVESEAASEHTVNAPHAPPVPIETPEPWPQLADPVTTPTYTSPEPDTFQTSTSSSPLPDYSSSSVSTYQPSTSAFTDCQTQTAAMYNFQATGAAQTASMQAATQPSNFYTKNG